MGRFRELDEHLRDKERQDALQKEREAIEGEKTA